ncbi:MAG: DNA internalization-related competence protein ComEC/Rec2 [Desulfobulbus propionicus]|nr:MAG: DNA internalization-related competence protein ComEC/Rec2 [Desulfobulbus propionicus]
MAPVWFTGCQRQIKANPLPVATLTYMTGTVLADVHGAAIHLPWPVVTVPLLFALLVLLGKKAGKTPSMLIAAMLSGVLHTSAALHPSLPADHVQRLITERTKVTLAGRVVSLPEFNGTVTRFTLRLFAYLRRDPVGQTALQPCRGLVRMSIKGPVDLVPGEQIMALARAGPIRNFHTPGVFDYRRHMAAQRIYVSAWINSPEAILHIEIPSQSPWKKFGLLAERIRQQIGHTITSTLDQEEAALYKALLTGDRSGISNDILEQFKATGTMHLLAISGLHLGLLSLIGYTLLRRLFNCSTWLLLKVHVPSLALCCTLPLLACYTLIAGAHAPVLRALLMAVLVVTGVLLGRQRNILALVAGAALLLLLFNPLALFTVSFQLSFAAVTAIALAVPTITAVLDTRHQRRLLIPLHWLFAAFLVALAATLGTLPLMLWHFHRISLVGPLVNLIVEPLLCFWALPLGLVALPVGTVFPGLGDLLLHTGAWGIDLALAVTSWVAGFNGVDLHTIQPTLYEIVLYLAGGTLLLRTVEKKGKILLPLFLLSLCLLSFILDPLALLRRDPDRVIFLDVGQGSATLVETGKKAWMIDCGGPGGPDFATGERIIAPCLWHRRIRKLEGIVISHPHSDHINGLEFLLEHFTPEVLILGQGQPVSQLIPSLELANQQGVRVIRIKAGDLVWKTPSSTLTCLGIPGLAPLDTLSLNDQSLVLKLTTTGYSVLFPGDITRVSEQALLNRQTPPEALRADILLAPHHGSTTSSSPGFIRAVAPRYIVVSSGRSNRGSFPATAHVRRWRKAGTTVLQTPDQGTIIFSLNKKTVWWKGIGEQSGQ